MTETARKDARTPHGDVVLTEGRGARPDMRVTVTDLAPTTTVIALSKTSHLSVLRQTAGAHWNKICDYLLVDETNGECRATLVELKSTLQRKSEALAQLRRSLPMVRYLLSVCSIEADTHLDPTVTYALIAERQTNRIDKQPTRPRAGRLDRERYGQIDVDIFVGAAVRAQHLVCVTAV